MVRAFVIIAISFMQALFDVTFYYISKEWSVLNAIYRMLFLNVYLKIRRAVLHIRSSGEYRNEL